jgi:hypothetical protein
MSVAPTIAIFCGCGVAVWDTAIAASAVTTIAIVLLRSIGVILLATEYVEQRPATAEAHPDVTVAVIPGVEARSDRQSGGGPNVRPPLLPACRSEDELPLQLNYSW